MLMDQIDHMDQMDKIGAPVFALTGYAVASHVIPRWFAVPQSGMAQAQIYRWVMQRILKGLFAKPTFRPRLFFTWNFSRVNL